MARVTVIKRYLSVNTLHQWRNVNLIIHSDPMAHRKKESTHRICFAMWLEIIDFYLFDT